jgi:eukaryotic-like serine/threonine-protein kinase
MEADPKLVDDRQAQHCYNAACAAALAAAGQGKDEPAPDDAAKLKLRVQARAWLQAELAAWSKLQDAQPQSRSLVLQILQHWRQDTDLAAIRDAAALAKLPQAEQKEWEKLWADVDAQLNRAQGQAPATAK